MVIAALSVALCFWPTPSAAQEAGQDAEAGPSGRPKLSQRWLTRIDPWHAIPSDLALRFGEAALSANLTPSQAARLLNDDRFVAAVGAPDQGWGLLEAMISSPATIADAWKIQRRGGATLTRSGVTSFQSALFLEHPNLRNGYLADVGLMIAVRADGVEVLVDIGTGRQVLGRDHLGVAVRAPGGGPLPSPAMSPEEVAAQMWEDAGIDPNDPDAITSVAQAPPSLPSGPGLNVRTDEPPEGAWLPAGYLVLGAFLVAWTGYAVVAIGRGLRRDPR
ncbi:MAG: hypothetical protein A2135_04955 [Actinobacteria bacterium RBG_16_67_15]|nr:MAG: hypothetical protein A2135_04955 [Actinobacteria bacterium RBG_16_67_15]